MSAVRPMDEAAAAGMVALQHCRDCGALQYPPGEICRACLSDALAWTRHASVPGRLLAAACLHHTHEPSIHAALPLELGLVRVEAATLLCYVGGGAAPGAAVSVTAAAWRRGARHPYREAAMTFRDRLQFDPARGEYRDGAIRYLMIRPDALMGILHQLPEAMRPEVLAAFARSIAQHGGQSARSYQAAGATGAAQLAATIQDTAPELGWGRWALTLGEDRIGLTVANSPFAAGHGPSATPVCHPILGMLRAIGPMLLGHSVDASETACAATGAPNCRFEALRRTES